MALTRITKGVIKPNENYDTHNINSTGIITATALDISGNASIAGVLTYEDVTSIDSVGIITAQNGLHVLNGYVGIGTAFPGEALDINSKTNSRAIRVYSEGSSSTSKLVLRTGDSGTSKIHFGDTSDIDTGEIRYRHNGDIMSFHVNANTERLTLDSDRLIIGENLSNNQPTYNSSTTLVTTHTNNPGAWNAIAIISGNTTGASFLKFGDRDDEDVSQIGHYNDDNSLRFYTNGGNERLRIDSDGRSLFTRGGLTASRNVGTKTGEIQLANSGNSSAITIINYSNEVSGPHLMFGKSRAGNATGSTIVQNGDRLGEIAFCGADGTDIDSFGAAIKCHVDGTPGANDMPSRLQFYTTGDGGASAVERLRITSGGAVGINETAPSAQLHVENDNANSSTYYLNTDAAVLIQNKNSNGTAKTVLKLEGPAGSGDCALVYGAGGTNMIFADRQHERLRITSSGQLLLGETSAFDSNTAIQFRKDNSGNTSDFVFRNRANNGNSRVQIKLSTLNRAGNADVVAGIEKYQSGGMAFYNGENTNQYAQMSFFNNGWGSLRLRNGNHSGYDVAHIAAYWGTSNGLMIEQGGPQSGTFKAIRFTTSHYGGERGYIGVTLGGTSYNNSSDYRMKQDIVDLTGAIDRVKSFKPKRFKWKEDPTYTVDGFLAHEASTVVPESVTGEKDAVDSNGDPEYQVMDNSKLVPVLTAALKEAIVKIETLEQDNIALRARVTKLEGN